MAVMSDITARVADMLARSDLDTQIAAEIGLACAHYSRQFTYVQELRAAELVTAASTPYYNTVDLTSGASLQGVTGRSAVPVTDVLRVVYMRRPTVFETIREIPFSDFERYRDSTSPGQPCYFARFAGQIGLWPTPNGVETLEMHVYIKPAVPSAADDTSVWFDQAQELIEARTARQVARKFIKDYEQAQDFALQEAEAMSVFVGEGARKMGTGRIRAHE